MLINGKDYGDLSFQKILRSDLDVNLRDLFFNEHCAADFNANAKELLSLFSLFDVDKNKELSKRELEGLTSIFKKADSDKKSQGVLTYDELENVVDAINSKSDDDIKFNKETVLAFIDKIFNANARNIAKNLDKQIEGYSLFTNTKDVMENINQDNVIEVLKNYENLTGRNLVDDVDNENFLNIKTIKNLICLPLARKAQQCGLVFPYKDIDNIADLKVAIKNITKEIGDVIDRSYHYEERENNGYRYVLESYRVLNGDNITNRQMFDKNGKLLNETRSVYSVSDNGVCDVSFSRKSYHGKMLHEHEMTYQYSVEGIEEYIMKNSKGGMYANINDLRKKVDMNLATGNEIKLVHQFDELVSAVLNAGVDYGVDPNLILSIIRQETEFDGLNKDATGLKGKGYMQLTTAPIRDFLGYVSKEIDDGDNDPKTKAHEYYYAKILKDSEYGWEMKELLLSRGFDPDLANSLTGTEIVETSVTKNSKTVKTRVVKKRNEKEKLVNAILNYLIKNQDTDFNIRLGTLVLRYYQKNKGYETPGNVRQTAFNYNGNSALQRGYSINVDKYYKQLRDTIPIEEKRDTLYQYQVRKAEF